MSETTTVSNLKPGDRFYKANDRKKIVWEMVEQQPKQTFFQTYRYFAKRDTDRFAAPVKGNTEIIFLRNKKDQV